MVGVLNNAHGNCYRSLGPSARILNLVIDWQIDYIGLVPQNEDSKYALDRVGTSPGLPLAFLCYRAIKAATIRELEKQSALYQYPLQMNSDQGSHCKGRDVQNPVKEHDIGGSITTITHK